MQATNNTAPAPAQILFMPVANGNSYDETHPALQSIVNGGLQILVGILAIVFNVVDTQYLLVSNQRVSITGQGFWCGVVFIVAGSLGISTGRWKTKCKIVAFMVLSIIASTFSAILFFFGLIGIFLAGPDMVNRCHSFVPGYTYERHKYDEECVHAHKVAVGTSICMCILAVSEAGLSIWGSVICCKTICFGASDQAAGVLYQTSYTTDGLVASQPGQMPIVPTPLPVKTQSPGPAE